ncbi:unnamed protein product [Toxocara canis]|uniref:Uncharacterized protein n=1 Tax=Toxocara canis TaxID=6265 RepID=A0A183VDE8_TOXCA|nr:unnamed protein product [Toxocara canis]
MDEKNKRAVIIGIPHATTEDANKQEYEMREAINARQSRQLSESYAKECVTKSEAQTIYPDQSDHDHSKFCLDLRHIAIYP